MTSRRTAEFRQLYRDLPERIQAATRKAYEIFRENPAHPGSTSGTPESDPRAWSVRITREYRAVAFRSGDDWVWIWIGTHKDFDRKFPV